MPLVKQQRKISPLDLNKNVTIGVAFPLNDTNMFRGTETVNEQNKSNLEEIMPFIKYFSADSIEPIVYVCQNYSCQLPTSDIVEATNLLK